MKKILFLLSLITLFSFTDINFEAFKSTAALSVSLVYVTGYSPAIFDEGWVFSSTAIDNMT